MGRSIILVSQCGQFVSLKVAGQDEQLEEPWWRILLGSHGLSLAQRLSELRDRPSQYLPGLQELHSHYDDLLSGKPRGGESQIAISRFVLKPGWLLRHLCYP